MDHPNNMIIPMMGTRIIVLKYKVIIEFLNIN